MTMIVVEFFYSISSERNVSQMLLLFLIISLLLSQCIIEVNKIGITYICLSNVNLKNIIALYQHEESETSQTMTNKEVSEILNDCNNDCINRNNQGK